MHRLHAGRSVVLLALLAAAGLTVTVLSSAQTPEEQRLLQPEWVTRIAGPLPALPPSPEGPGTWAPWRANYYNEAPGLGREWGLDARQLATFDRNLQAIVTRLREAPVLQEAHRIRLWTPSGSLLAGGEAHGTVPMARRPVEGSVMIGPWVAEWTKRDAKGQLRAAGETSHFIVNVNVIPTAPEAEWMEDAEGVFFPLYRPPSPIPGTQVVAGRQTALLVTRPGRPDPYGPVSRARVIQAQIATYRDADRVVEASLRAAKAELAAYFSPEQTAERERRVRQEADGFIRMNRMTDAAAMERARARELGRQRALETAANPPATDPVFSMVRARDALRAQLDGMSAGERNAPAWVSAASRWLPQALTFVAPGTPGAVPLVQVNPAFFDAALPRTSIQILMLPRMGRYGDAAVARPDRVNPPDLANLLLLRQVDWTALAAALP